MEAELDRIAARLAAYPDPFEHAGLFAAQQALRWAMDRKATPRPIPWSHGRTDWQVQKIVRWKAVAFRCQVVATGLGMLPDYDIDISAADRNIEVMPLADYADNGVDEVPPPGGWRDSAAYRADTT